MKFSTIKFSIIIFTLFCFSFRIAAQDMDCASKIKYRYANKTFKIDDQSKSAICYSGQKYEYNVFVSAQNEYRFSFFASAVFNNNIRFKIINTSTGELLLNLPGEAAGNNTSAILEDYFDPQQKKFIHPFYEIIPDKDCNYQVIVEVGEIKENNILTNSKILVESDQKKGCVTVFMQSKSAENFGF